MDKNNNQAVPKMMKPAEPVDNVDIFAEQPLASNNTWRNTANHQQSRHQNHEPPTLEQPELQNTNEPSNGAESSQNPPSISPSSNYTLPTTPEMEEAFYQDDMMRQAEVFKQQQQQAMANFIMATNPHNNNNHQASQVPQDNSSSPASPVQPVEVQRSLPIEPWAWPTTTTKIPTSPTIAAATTIHGSNNSDTCDCDCGETKGEKQRRGRPPKQLTVTATKPTDRTTRRKQLNPGEVGEPLLQPKEPSEAPAENNYLCPKCGKKYKNETTLARHRHRGHGNPNSMCIHCNKPCARPDTLKLHV